MAPFTLSKNRNEFKLKHLDLTGEDKAPAIVIGLDCLQGLSTARILASHGIPVIGIARDPDYHCCKTNSCREIFIADTTSEDLIGLLIELAPKLAKKAVLFPCQDKNVLHLSQQRTRLQDDYRLVMPSHEIVASLVDKVEFYEKAAALDLPLPQTKILRSREDAEDAARMMKYPCLLKPPWRPESWTSHTKVKAVRADDAASFLSLFDHYHQWTDILIAQQWITGPEENHYTCNSFYDENFDPLVTFTSRKLRQWLPQTGQACLAEECPDERVVEVTHELFKKFRFQGLGYLEMKRDEESGDYLIIETNVARPTGRSCMAEAAGIELIYTMYCHALALPLPANQYRPVPGRKWIHELRDLQAAYYHWKQGNLSLRQWLRSISGPKKYAIFAKDDPAPFFAAVKNAMPVFFSKKERGSNDAPSA